MTQKEKNILFRAALNGILSNPYLMQQLYENKQVPKHKRKQAVIDTANEIADLAVKQTGYIK